MRECVISISYVVFLLLRGHYHGALNDTDALCQLWAVEALTDTLVRYVCAALTYDCHTIHVKTVALWVINIQRYDMYSQGILSGHRFNCFLRNAVASYGYQTV